MEYENIFLKATHTVGVDSGRAVMQPCRKLKDSVRPKQIREYFYFVYNKKRRKWWAGLAGGNLNNLTGIKSRNISIWPSPRACPGLFTLCYVAFICKPGFKWVVPLIGYLNSKTFKLFWYFGQSFIWICTSII